MRLAGAVGVAGIGAASGLWGLRVPLLGLTALASVAWVITIRRRARIALAFRPEPLSNAP